MDRTLLDLWVGIFVAIGIAALFVLALKVGNASTTFNTGATYHVTAEFDNIVSATPDAVSRLANLDSIELVTGRKPGLVASVDPAFELYVDLGRHLDLKAEIARIDKEKAALEKKLEQTSKKLGNPKFLAGAAPEVVESEKAKSEEFKEMLAKLDTLRQEYEASI